MTLVEFDDVSVRYDTQKEGEHALQDVSTDIKRGSIVGIVGPSEAGKSTFLRTVASYVPNHFDCVLEGQVTVGGTAVTGVTIGNMSSRVGMLFENPFDQLTGATSTVVEEVAYGLENQGLPRDKIMARTYESLERVGITDLMDRNPYNLSGGQSQRVALASILALRPEILLLDEPTSQLDPSGTDDVFAVIEAMNTSEYTTLVVSQDLDRLAPLADRLLVLEDGELRADNVTRDVLTREDLDTNLFVTPETVRIGTRLRAKGYVDPSIPVPLKDEALVEELSSVKTERSFTSHETLADQDSMLNSETNSSVETPIVFEGVGFKYDDIEALRNISLTIGPGCTCLIGQNGAGKSTFARHLNGLLEPTTGRVLINEQDTQERQVAQLARSVALSFQNPDNQLFHDSVAEEVRYGPKNLGYDEETINELTRSAIERMRLVDTAEKHPYDLGLAARKRIAVASILAMDTDIIVLDEPTGGQDKEGVTILGEAVESLVSEGKTVVIVTHDMDFVRDYADRVIALCQGEVLLDADPRTVFSQEETLEETHVKPPKVTEFGRKCKLNKTILDVDELFGVIGTKMDASR